MEVTSVNGSSTRGPGGMLRREARLRKEFLYRKALEERENKLQEGKARIKEALESNRPIPAELRQDAVALASAATFDEGVTSMCSAFPRFIISFFRHGG